VNIPTFEFEQELWKKGYKYVCGIDEVGRGPLAGPVVAAAVIFPTQILKEDFFLKFLKKSSSGISQIRDSKQLSPVKRQNLDPLIKQNCLAYSIAEISVDVINREGIVGACQKAYRKCLVDLNPKADFILMDAFYIKEVGRDIQKPIIKGDQKSVTIAAASIIAKVYRDNLMCKLHEELPNYHFDEHKGYGTKKHMEAIKTYGLCPHHRVNFIPDRLLNPHSFRQDWWKSFQSCRTY